MSNGIVSLPEPYNEPVRTYAPGSEERAALKAELERQRASEVEIPLVIGGREVRTGRFQNAVCPHDHGHVLARVHLAGETEIRQAIDAALAAKAAWEATPWQDRAAVFLRAASLLSERHRYRLNAATMLGQSKTAREAEIDAACETADYLRYNVRFMEEIYQNQPASFRDTWNRMEFRPLEGFVLAVTPFNFTAIAANLSMAPALMGNTVVWKPASTSLLSNYYLMRLFQEAGLPEGVLNFIPGPGSLTGKVALDHEAFAGLHFTGSTGVFNHMWRTAGEHLGRYRSYPRLVGETGGKNFTLLHPFAGLDEAAVAVVRSAFEYQGQKCSACSRLYVPASLWPGLRDRMEALLGSIRMGGVEDFQNFMGAVIDEAAFDQTKAYIDRSREASEARVLFGGGCDKRRGYFVEPTVILTEDPHFLTMEEEIFAPVLTVFVYDDARLEETLDLITGTSPYGLTGSFFAQDRSVIRHLTARLSAVAGNLYINDKCTGAVVGHQPFGGGRASGTNDKAGSSLNLLRWSSPRVIKECFVPSTSLMYPFMFES
jgi:1-pyrroline-5-carboxylate dehydrogenase